MLKKIVFILSCAALLLTAGAAFAAPKFHIGIVTSTVSQGEDVVRGAERLIQMYGDVSRGGMIKHVTYPDNFGSEMETVITQIAGLADDPLMKVVVVTEGVPGTAEAFRRIKEKNKNILCFTGQPQEDPNMIAGVADLAVNSDTLAMGYIMPLAAKKLGAKTYVHISFPRHMSYELLSRRRKVIEAACRDLGIRFAFETAPDPTSDVGVAGAQQYVLEKVPTWLNKYGKQTAFFSTNDAQVEPLLRQITELGGYYVQTDSPLQGYAGALGIDLSKEKGNWKAILSKIEQTVVSRGGKGRLATWPYPSGYCIVAGLAEYGKRVVEHKAKMGRQADVMKAFEFFSPGMAWNSSAYTDASSGVRLRNFLLIYQDTYVFGKGTLHLNKIKVPEKYYKIK